MTNSNNKNLIIINHVRKDNLITDLLERLGHTPVSSYRDKLLYLCPLPGHNETKPSFTVYDKPDSYQNFYCFGCKKSGDIVSLYSLLKGTSWRDSLAKFGGNLDISGDQELSYLISQIRNDYDRAKEDVKKVFDDISLEISSLGLTYLESVEYDEEEIEFMDKFYKKIDFLINTENLQELLSVYDFILGDNELSIPPFRLRQQEWENKKCQK